VNRSEIAQRRLASQHLVGAKLDKPIDVVAKLGAVQAQDYAGAKWAVAQRMRDADDATVEQAVIDGSIVRTHVLRPTWHFVAAADIRWMLGLTAPRVRTVMSSYNRKLELDNAVFSRSARALTRALQGGKHLMRSEHSAALRRAGINVSGTQRLAHLVMEAELAGIICSGPRRGKQFTYALLDERVPPTAPLERDEALLRLSNIYFATRGPATPTDFSWWSGLTVGDARKGIDLAGSSLEQASVDGRTYWFAPSPLAPITPSGATHLLPNYDEYFIGYRDRSAIAERLKKARSDVRTDTLMANVVVVGGQLVGGWKRISRKDRVIVDVSLLTNLNRTERKAVASAARSYGEFLGIPVELVI